ncbi:hypothetical protein PoB_007240300 [Plakobranchus ocellatus]|uniref:Uncharacterized protein n=1 Tax=Plakobranchus ocellatus TaxID=259542 RepID=A0AAV4DNL3_9GAST|nr:hypothetical protein PoB_007240300 [Plakobranchus ocellatus]
MCFGPRVFSHLGDRVHPGSRQAKASEARIFEVQNGLKPLAVKRSLLKGKEDCPGRTDERMATCMRESDPISSDPRVACNSSEESVVEVSQPPWNLS